MAARVLACATCHGAEGQGTSDDYFPRLAGKPAGYLYNQLVAFRDGRRRYPPMNYLLEFLPDAYLKEIAEYFAVAAAAVSGRPRCPIVSKEILARGEALVTNGDPQRGRSRLRGLSRPDASPGWSPPFPACSGCAPATSARSSGAWRYGTRTAAAPDCMQIVAGLLTEDDVTAVAAWLVVACRRPPIPSPAPRGTFHDAARLRQRTELRGMSCRYREP